ncbi:DUF3558 domain-containing protein [Streptomyces litchfieldiae]|uniref:DUF3558 domain-containing protein n=1 Tax=Streptomyces litchfieldiae TaxID=3075543 RepID=A0ABU2MQQ4_9ACTN|nr:DUF3558 domain-containing protein [Streptomyces sp. DSM 44938]MDT0343424.1 DUF3558 domain-containing protein [Streptomyces sp. DSM 44938]
MLRTMAVRCAVLAAAAVCGLAACAPGLGGTDDPAGTGPPGDSADTAQTGRYSGLPEPCGSVNGETLRELLPDGDPETYAGEPMETYDTGRRSGCDWSNTGDTDSQQLSVDFLRVISYDPAVSDDDQAQLDFQERATEAGIPAAGTEPAIPPAEDALDSRALEGLGDGAFIDDVLTETGQGDRRNVTVTFRNANVIVTVTYTVSTTLTDAPPDSARLQQRAQTVAQQLAGALDE